MKKIAQTPIIPGSPSTRPKVKNKKGPTVNKPEAKLNSFLDLNLKIIETEELVDTVNLKSGPLKVNEYRKTFKSTDNGANYYPNTIKALHNIYAFGAYLAKNIENYGYKTDLKEQFDKLTSLAGLTKDTKQEFVVANMTTIISELNMVDNILPKLYAAVVKEINSHQQALKSKQLDQKTEQKKTFQEALQSLNRYGFKGFDNLTEDYLANKEIFAKYLNDNSLTYQNTKLTIDNTEQLDYMLALLEKELKGGA